MKNLKLLLVSLAILFSHNLIMGQNSKDSNKEKSAIKSALNAFKFRSIGPAFMSGRIADIAIDPKNENVWYVAVGSGGVWKTENSGTTWSPIADNMPFYSTGCITIDPNNNASIFLDTIVAKNFQDNAAAVAAGLTVGEVYHRDGVLAIVI